MIIMAEPHQRTKSGKLRRANIYSENIREGQQRQQHKRILVGAENADSIEDVDPEDELQMFQQTPTTLSDTQVSVLKDVAEGLGLKGDDYIDRNWRRTWNIGAWCVSRSVSISANLMQPNIAGMWANIQNTDAHIINKIADKYRSFNLERSKATVKASSRVVELKGRWTPYILDSLYTAELIRPEQVEITYVNITQSRLFFWVIVEDKAEYLCTPSYDTLELISRYLPKWAFDVCETSAGGGLSIKLKGSRQIEDAKKRDMGEKTTSTQLSINSIGWLQCTGSEVSVRSLYEALATAIRSLMHSIHLTTFMQSLEYKIPKDSLIS